MELTRADGELVLTINPHVLPEIQHRLNDGRNGALAVDGVGEFAPRQLALLAHVLPRRGNWPILLQGVSSTPRGSSTRRT